MEYRDAEVAALKKIQKDFILQFESLQSLTAKYNQFVAGLENDGYGDWLVEFDNDISVREIIEDVIHSGELNNFEEFRNGNKKLKKSTTD